MGTALDYRVVLKTLVSEGFLIDDIEWEIAKLVERGIAYDAVDELYLTDGEVDELRSTLVAQAPWGRTE
jgi:hypothetical protein